MRIVVPPIVAFALVVLYVIAEGLGFRGLAAAEPGTISEAAATGHAARALALIAQGQNPNVPQHVGEGVLDSSAYELRPLEAAILGRHLEMARLLQRSGAAHFDTTRAVCFARARLPEFLPDLHVSASESADVPKNIDAAVRMCVGQQ
jgi:hypothetical protein